MVILRGSNSEPHMSLVGQVLLLPHRSTDDRFTPISRLYLKLIVREVPEAVVSRCSNDFAAMRAYSIPSLRRRQALAVSAAR
jgi:hypothetical protein